jgi:hypothetical protein
MGENLDPYLALRRTKSSPTKAHQKNRLSSLSSRPQEKKNTMRQDAYFLKGLESWWP